MPDTTTEPEHPGSPLEWTRRVLRRAWRDLKSVYYANTVVWRLLKSGALVFFGLFLWAGGNLLLSYRPDWGFLYYVMAYGFVLLFWGPFTHLVVVPTIIRLRRSGRGGVFQWFARHGTTTNLTVFFVIVLLLGTFPLGVMTFEFQLPTGGPGTDVNPRLQCTQSGDVVHCHLSSARGIDHLVITSGGRTVGTVDEPPFDFDVRVGDLETVRDDRQFTVELRDENGDTIRRYVRRIDLIPG